MYDGYNTYKYNTMNYITGSNIVYDNIGFLREVNFGRRIYLDNERGIPVLLEKNDLGYKWNSNFFYTTQTTPRYYISPSTSQIQYDWDFASNCDSVCPTDYEPDDCPIDYPIVCPTDCPTNYDIFFLFILFNIDK